MNQPAYNPGDYVGRVTTWGLSESSVKKTPQFVLRFEVLGKRNPNDPDGKLMACPRQDRTIYRVIAEKTIEYLIDDLKQLGYDRGSFKYLDPAATGAHDFHGREIAVRCTHEDYDGQVRERWSLARQGSSEIQQMDSKSVRNLDAMFGRHLKCLATDQQEHANEGAKAIADEFEGRNGTNRDVDEVSQIPF